MGKYNVNIIFKNACFDHLEDLDALIAATKKMLAADEEIVKSAVNRMYGGCPLRGNGVHINVWDLTNPDNDTREKEGALQYAIYKLISFPMAICDTR